MGYIASGNYEKQGSLNLLKSGAELAVGRLGEGVDKLADLGGYDFNLEEGGKNAGGWIFECADFYFGAKGVKVLLK